MLTVGAGILLAAAALLEPDTPTTGVVAEAEKPFMSYDECVAWKAENRFPRDDAEVSRVIHCERIMKMYISRLLKHGEGHARENDARRNYYIR
jgi:hypothetical protein